MLSESSGKKEKPGWLTGDVEVKEEEWTPNSYVKEERLDSSMGNRTFYGRRKQ